MPAPCATSCDFGRGVRLAGKLQEDFLEAHGRGTQFIQVPARFDHGARQIAADQPAFSALDLEDVASFALLFEDHFADAGNLFQTLLDRGEIEIAIAAADLDEDGFGPARAALQIVDGIRCDHLAFVDDDDLLAGLLDFRQDMRAQNNGVIAGEALDQIARFVNLLGIEARGRFVQNKHVGIMNDGLGQPDALTIAFGEFADQLVADIGDGAALANVIHALGELRFAQSF